MSLSELWYKIWHYPFELSFLLDLFLWCVLIFMGVGLVGMLLSLLILAYSAILEVYDFIKKKGWL